MIQEYTYISINEILARVKRHPFLENISFEKVVQYVVDFFHLVGIPKMFMDKCEVVDINDFRGLLPCDLVQINQIKDLFTKKCLRSMTDNFNPHRHQERTELSFKTQGNILFVSFPKGKVEISYKALPVDKDGYPLLLNNPIFLNALELYIKKCEFDLLFDMSQIPAVVLNNAHQQYGWAVGRLSEMLTQPSVSEMESISRMWNTLVQRTTDFDSGFNHLGDRETLKYQY
jgi:hypothetical protein